MIRFHLRAEIWRKYAMNFFKRQNKKENKNQAAQNTDKKYSEAGFVGGSKAMLVACTAVIVAALVSAIPFFNSKEVTDTEYKYQDIALLAKERLKLEDFGEAIELFEQAIEINPADEELYIGLADSYKGANDTEKARKALETGYNETGSDNIKVKLNALDEADPSEKFDEFMNNGREALENNDKTRALENFLHALEIDPKSAEAYLLAADSCTGTEEAVSILEKGFELTKSGEIHERIELLKPPTSEVTSSPNGNEEKDEASSKAEKAEVKSADTVEVKTHTDKNLQMYKNEVIFESSASWFELIGDESCPGIAKINSDVDELLNEYFNLDPTKYGASDVEELYANISEYGKIQADISIKALYCGNNIVSYISDVEISSPDAFSSTGYHTADIKTGEELKLGDILAGEMDGIKKSVSDAYTEAGIKPAENESDDISFYLESDRLVLVSSSGEAYIPFSASDKFKIPLTSQKSEPLE